MSVSYGTCPYRSFIAALIASAHIDLHARNEAVRLEAHEFIDSPAYDWACFWLDVNPDIGRQRRHALHDAHLSKARPRKAPRAVIPRDN